MGECDKIVCFKCNNVGHRIKDCPSKEENVRCFRCRKSGHKETNCNLLILNNTGLNDQDENLKLDK